MKEPIKGKEYLCIKTVVMDSKYKAYIKGKVYISEQNRCITNEKNNANHFWTKKGMNKFFTETQETFEITKEQILELKNTLHKERVDYLIKEWFPEVFEVKLEVGKWYKRPHNKALFFIVSDPEIAPFEVYGFDIEGRWMNVEKARTFPDSEIIATEQEVFEALKNEAVNRGFVEGVYLEQSGINKRFNHLNKPINGKFFLDNHGFTLDSDNGFGYIFHKGQWATILETKTKEEAEKLLNCKIV